jgi:Fe2+ transport system protein B
MDFLSKVTHVVIISAVIMWFLATFPLGSNFENSYAAMIGKTIAPIGHLAGLNWKLISRLFLGSLPKKQPYLPWGCCITLPTDLATLVQYWPAI